MKIVSGFYSQANPFLFGGVVGVFVSFYLENPNGASDFDVEVII